MDFITHSLVGAGAARMICPQRSWRPQLTLAGLLGSLAMDGDSWLALLGPHYYSIHGILWTGPQEESTSMDFITHSLVGAGAARMICPQRSWRPQLTLAGLLGSLAMDGDSWLALLGPHYYGLYHRVWTHNLVGLGVIALVGTCASRTAGGVAAWRRFGWFADANLPLTETPSPAPWGYLLFVSLAAAYLHLLFDMISGYGNLYPFWPWGRWEASLRAVNSFDLVVFGLTLGWHITIRRLDWPRRREAWITAAYGIILTLYVLARLRWCQPAFI